MCCAEVIFIASHVTESKPDRQSAQDAKMEGKGGVGGRRGGGGGGGAMLRKAYVSHLSRLVLLLLWLV